MTNAMADKILDARDKFSHVVDPYGYIEMGECRLVARQGDDGRDELFAIGDVIRSPWNGALLCGVPCGKQRDKYPVGSRYEIKVTRAQWDAGLRRDIAM